ncbi:MAG: peptidase T, partial [Christensenellales bacterium]
MKVKEKFLRYAATDTASEPDSPKTPSTDKQRVFAEMLCDELRGMGAEDVKITDNAYVYARIPSNVKRDIPKIGFIAHLDTAPAVSGTGVKPRVFENYDGGTLEIGNGVSIRPEEFCHHSNYIGQDIITSSGDTLLG